MIAEWMLYSVVASAALAICATIVERALLNGRASVRFVWIASIALSILVPFTSYQIARRSPGPVAVVGVEAVTPFTGDTIFLLPEAASASAHSNQVPQQFGSAQLFALEQYDASLRTLWMMLSLILACSYAGSVASLAYLRRRWKSQTVHGVDVLMSDHAGPALVGTFSTDIVLPQWVLTLSESQQRLMLQHEMEHRRAHDSQLLMLARLALVLMPWNPVLWWSVFRLRAAVEFDCDARVLQSADARLYGDLILKVAGAKSKIPVIAATAFAERATQLERRISVLTRHRVATSRLARLMAVAIALIVPTAAWIAPHPAVPATTTPAPDAVAATNAQRTSPAQASSSNDSSSTEQKHATANGHIAAPSAAEMKSRADSLNDSTKSSRLDARTNIDDLPRPRAAIQSDSSRAATQAIAQNNQSVFNSVRDSLQRAQVQRLTDTIYAILYGDISLSATEQQAARQLIAKLETEQQVQTSAYLVQRQSMQARRDSALRALLAGSDDRAVLDARLVAGPGARGAAPAANTPLVGGRGGRAGGSGAPPDGARGGARIGGAGTPGNNPGSATDMAFRRFFDGITLTAEQEAAARVILTDSQNQIANAPPPSVIRINIQTRAILVGAPDDSSLVSLGSNAADRSRIRSRILTVPR